MNALADTIWREFGVEAEEHLQLIEQVLVHSTDTVSAAQVAQLFRSFHSLKGLGRTLGLMGIETIAHLAENILGVVRDGAAVLDQPLTECLLQGVDALKDLVHHASTTRADAPPPDAVVVRLKQMDARLTGSAAGAAEPAPPELALSDDDEMLVFFAEGLAETVPELGRTLADSRPEVRQAARESAETIAHGADMLGFALLRDNALAIAALVAEDPGADTEERLRELLKDVTAQADIIAELSGTDAGARHLTQSLADSASDSAALMEPVEDALAGLADADEAELDIAADALAAAAHAAFRWAGGAGRPRLADLFLHMVDLCQRAGRREIPLVEPLLAWFRSVVSEARASADPSAAEANALIAELRRFLGAEPIAPEEPLAHCVAGVAIPAGMMEVLSLDHLAAITEAVGNGRSRLYTVRAFLEQNNEIAQRFVQWLQASCRPITNRTIIDGTATGFEFLVLSDLAAPDFKRQLLDLDPGSTCITQAVALGTEGEDALVSPAARTVEAARPPEPATHSVIRVRSESIDDLVRLIGETLVIANGIGAEIDQHATAAELAALRSAIAQSDNATALAATIDRLAEGLRAITDMHQRLDLAIQHLHEQTIELRVVPLDTLFTRLLRAAREMAQSQDKAIACEAEGRDVRIDKTIVEQLAAPLTHMVRNAIDHGIEKNAERAATAKPPTARFALQALQRGNEVTIQLSDDGRGLDEARILATAIKRGLVTKGEADFLPRAEICRLIFLPGFSTAETVSETSGRGVGMDVVLTAVTALGGRIDIDSEPGQGTTFSIHLPLSAALQTALLIGVGDQVLAMPERHLAEVRKVDRADIHTVRGQACLGLRGSLLPVFSMAELMGLPPSSPAPDAAIPILVIASGASRIGLMVDQLFGRQELYMKDLHPRLAAIPGIGGASVLGDGQVVLVLESEGLIRRARQHAAATTDGGVL